MVWPYIIAGIIGLVSLGWASGNISKIVSTTPAGLPIYVWVLIGLGVILVLRSRQPQSAPPIIVVR